jgi:uncharacterized protein GlcG (DUF336 family)
MTLPLIDTKTLSQGAAEKIAAAAAARSAAIGVPVSIAILDGARALLHFVRLDGVHHGTVEVAIAKARTAFNFRRPTAAFGERVATGQIGLLAIDGLMPFAGGLPLMHAGALVGAIGVSGGTPDQDADIASAGAVLMG